jgi:hypothetical protein
VVEEKPAAVERGQRRADGLDAGQRHRAAARALQPFVERAGRDAERIDVLEQADEAVEGGPDTGSRMLAGMTQSACAAVASSAWAAF